MSLYLKFLTLISYASWYMYISEILTDFEVVHGSYCRNVDDDDAYDFWLKQCVEGHWPEGRPMPLPVWNDSRPPYEIHSIEDYKLLTEMVEKELRIILKTYNYDAISDFIEFYKQYKNEHSESFEEFFRGYKPPLLRNANNCVGQSLILIGKLAQHEEHFPGLTKCLYMVSSEIEIKNLEKYKVENFPDLHSINKQHVLIAIQIILQGRYGVILLEPGYGVGNVITVMSDQMFPHTGQFVPFPFPDYKFSYEMSLDSKFVERKKWDKSPIVSTNFIYIGASYVTPVDVSERLSLVHKVRVLKATDENGHLLAIFLFHLKYQSELTFLYLTENENYAQIKVPYSDFTSKGVIDDSKKSFLNNCREYFGLTENEFQNILTTVTQILADKTFLENVDKIYDDIHGG